MEILDYELQLRKKLTISNGLLKFVSIIIGLIYIIEIIIYGAILIIFNMNDISDGFMIILAIISLIISIIMLPLGVGYPLIMKKKIMKEIRKIENNTAKFEKFTVAAQIISKSRESSTRVYGKFGTSGDISSTTSHDYIVGVRTVNGNLITIGSKELYLGSTEGEFIDILIKQKLDKNGELLDSSNIPLMQTIRATL